MNAQADLDLLCPHVLSRYFFHIARLIYVIQSIDTNSLLQSFNIIPDQFPMYLRKQMCKERNM